MPVGSSDSLSLKNKCVHIHDPFNQNPVCLDDETRMIITHQKSTPIYVYSIIPYRKSSSINRSNVKLEIRSSGGRRRQTSTSNRPMSAGGGEINFDPFGLLGIERRDGVHEVSYGHLLVPSRSNVPVAKVRIKYLSSHQEMVKFKNAIFVDVSSCKNLVKFASLILKFKYFLNDFYIKKYSFLASF